MRLAGQITLWFSLVLLWNACSRPGEKRCAQVCEHYLDLYVADKFDERVHQAADDSERAAVEAERAEEYKQRRDNPEYGFDACINRCNRRTRGEVVDCIMAAKTLATAKECDAEEGCQIAAGGGRNSLGGLLLVLATAALLFRRKRRGWRCGTAVTPYR